MMFHVLFGDEYAIRSVDTASSFFRRSPGCRALRCRLDGLTTNSSRERTNEGNETDLVGSLDRPVEFRDSHSRLLGKLLGAKLVIHQGIDVNERCTSTCIRRCAG